jgi:hypothetical protein
MACSRLQTTLFPLSLASDAFLQRVLCRMSSCLAVTLTSLSRAVRRVSGQLCKSALFLRRMIHSYQPDTSSNDPQCGQAHGCLVMAACEHIRIWVPLNATVRTIKAITYDGTPLEKPNPLAHHVPRAAQVPPHHASPTDTPCAPVEATLSARSPCS